MITIVPPDLVDASPFTAREMTHWQRLRSRLSIWWTLNVVRRIPHLVWFGDELDVVVSFRNPDLQAMRKADEAMTALGLEFDTGWGFGGEVRERDWEWDYCLRGPVSVQFKGRAKYPERREARPMPTLVDPENAA